MHSILKIYNLSTYNVTFRVDLLVLDKTHKTKCSNDSGYKGKYFIIHFSLSDFRVNMTGLEGRFLVRL